MAAVVPPKLPGVDSHRPSALTAELYLRELAAQLQLKRQELDRAGVVGQDLAAAIRKAASEAEEDAVTSCGFSADVVMGSLRQFSGCREVAVAAKLVALLCDPSAPAPKVASEELQLLLDVMDEARRRFLAEVESMPDGCFPSSAYAMVQLSSVVDSKTTEACIATGMDPDDMNAAMTRFSQTAEVTAALKRVTEEVAMHGTRLTASAGSASSSAGGAGEGNGGGNAGGMSAQAIVSSHAGGMMQMAMMLASQVRGSGASGDAAGGLFEAAKAANYDDMNTHVISQTCGTPEALAAAVAELEGSGEAGSRFVMKAMRAIDIAWQLAKHTVVAGCSPDEAASALGISPADLDLAHL